MRNHQRIGYTLHVAATGGMFLWAKKIDHANAASIASKAAKQGIILAPGNLFRPHQQPSPWLRFNVASCGDPGLFRFLAGE